VAAGTFVVPLDGQAWKMACGPSDVRSTDAGQMTSLVKLGWRGRVGSIVPHRNGKFLYDNPDDAAVREGQVIVRVLWCKVITSDGRFDAHRMDDLGQTYAVCESDCPGLVRQTSIVVQRTSNKLQRRRINAAVLPRSFIGKDGVLAENHVVVLTPPDGTPDDELLKWAALLSSEDFDSLFKERSGTVTVSIRLLMQLRFPKSWIPQIEHLAEHTSSKLADETSCRIPTVRPSTLELSPVASRR
jgi:adenine-specific DNA-methyltransferase